MEQLINNMELYLKASVLMSFIAAFSGGVVASLTPCVYPMIPITASFVGSRNLGGSRMKGFVLSLLYISGVAVTYAVMGVFAAVTGRLFGEINTNPYAFFIVANIIIILGLGMLDVFTIPMIAPKSSQKHNGVLGVFVMGMVSGFVAGPCTAPVLGVLLAYVASTRNILLGGSLLFVFAFGMGILLILVGTFSGVLAALPKSGEWMVKIKKALGIFMIGLGEYFLIKTGQLIL
ncbi:MAG: cytochrome C biogenesis protein [Desulfobacterales bacterium]|nr:cytochrome C biogenesis protein [Desulfobacterales bacterium]